MHKQLVTMETHVAYFDWLLFLVHATETVATCAQRDASHSLYQNRVT